MKIVYIAHPIGGDVENNLKSIREIVREINLKEPEIVPFVPYYADVVSMDDSIEEERDRGIKNDLAILKKPGMVDELRLYGPRISLGMLQEIKVALNMGIPIVATSRKMELAMVFTEIFGEFKTHQIGAYTAYTGVFDIKTLGSK